MTERSEIFWCVRLLRARRFKGKGGTPGREPTAKTGGTKGAIATPGGPGSARPFPGFSLRRGVKFPPPNATDC